MLKIKKKEINIYRCLFYVIGLIIVILYHMRFDLSYGDVVDIYGNVLQPGSEYFPQNGNVFEAIYNFTVFHYQNWSSRSIIEIFLIIVGIMPVMCWYILDIVSVLLIGYCLDKLTEIENQKIKYLCIFSFLMMYQVSTMGSAGWIATTINYSWVVAAGLYLFLIIQCIRKEKHITIWSYVMACVAAVYAMNQEQMNGMLLLCLVGLFFWDIKNKKFKKSLIPFFIINVIEFIAIYRCPGNANRKYVEMISYYPEYQEYSLRSKIYEGICAMLKGIFDIRGMAFVTITILGLLVYLSFVNKKFFGIKIMSVVALLYSVVKFISSAVPQMEENTIFGDYRINIPATILGGCVLCCTLVVCYANVKKLEECMMLGWFMACAAATKVILGFSIAFLVSGERTSIYMEFILIMVALFLIKKFEDVLTIFKKTWFCIGVYFVNIILFVWNYYCICRGVSF